MMNQCSDLFSEVFDSHGGEIVRTCACGRTFYNYMDSGLFEEGELEDLEKKCKAEPNKYYAVDHIVGYMRIGGVEIVYDCPCDTAQKYEKFILAHAAQLAEYLRRYAVELREKANKVDVPNNRDEGERGGKKG